MANDKVDELLTCPISFDRMQDPVTLVQTGQTYDRKSLCEWLLTDPTLCPASNQRFTDKLEYVDNLIARKLLVEVFGDRAYQRHDDSDFEKRYDAVYRNQRHIKDKKNADAQNRLGLRYFLGDGVAQDYEQARLCYERAVELGSPQANFNLGNLYCLGYGVPQDYDQARLCYERAAELGCPDANCNLGTFYCHGKGVASDYTKARFYYELAAEQGHPQAQFSLGVMYQYGYGVSRDYTKARQHYNLAAEQGHADAQCNLGFLYQHGNGVSQDNIKARHYYGLAAEQGLARAQNYLELQQKEKRGRTGNWKRAFKN
jgi:TPR repeat protein